MADDCVLIIKIISFILIQIWSVRLFYLPFIFIILVILKRGIENGGKKLATVDWLLNSERLGLKCLFMLIVREEVGGTLMYRLLNSALNISSCCLIGLKIRKGEESKFIADITCVESDLRDEIWAHWINAVIFAAASAPRICCNILAILFRLLLHYKIRIHFNKLSFCQ